MPSGEYNNAYGGITNQGGNMSGGASNTMSTMDIGGTAGGYDSHYAPIKASPNASAGSMGSQYGQLSLINAGRERFQTAAPAPDLYDTTELQRNASPHDLPEVPTYSTQGESVDNHRQTSNPH